MEHEVSSQKCPTHKEKLVVKRQTHAHCRLCGVKLTGKYLSCGKPLPCITLCNFCLICDAGHRLGKVFDLSRLGKGDALLQSNRFLCRGCGKEQQLEGHLLRCHCCRFQFCAGCEQAQLQLTEAK